ncbi:hypothetical protein [Jatrophihabitans endophyticus]|nr:hypothetical protein [Jatrophihabitans endophyticus]MBE7186648.1 hypothetical protein [Jatrophihabitans endophyticus]
MRPGGTVLLLMASATGLAVLILAMLFLVGRRPDPRVAASADRLRSRVTD